MLVVSLLFSTAVPLDQPVYKLEKSKALIKYKNILSKVKQYIDELLDPSKAPYVDNVTVNEVLKFLNIAEVGHYDARSLSPTSDYEIHLRGARNSCIINTYNQLC